MCATLSEYSLIFCFHRAKRLGVPTIWGDDPLQGEPDAQQMKQRTRAQRLEQGVEDPGMWSSRGDGDMPLSDQQRSFCARYACAEGPLHADSALRVGFVLQWIVTPSRS